MLFRPCSSYLFLFSTYKMLFFLHPFWYSCITFFRTPDGFFFFLVLIFLTFLVWLVLLCSRTRYASTCLTLINWRCLSFLCLSLYHRICISLGWRISTDTGCCEVTARRHRVSPCRSAYYASPWWLLSLSLRRRRREAALFYSQSRDGICRCGALARLISWLSRIQNVIRTIRKRTNYLFLV